MSHKIDNSKGFYAFVSQGTPGWHGVGTTEKGIISAAEGLQKAGADFDVIKLPNIHILPSGKEIISDNSFFTLRTDTEAILGDKFGKVYEVLQNAEIFAIVDTILQKGTATIESAGVLEGGKKVFICLKINKPLMIGGKDQVDQYLLIATSHDGSLSITAMETPIRVVCWNTLTAALNGAKGAIKIRHTNTSSDRLVEAMKVLNMLDKDSDLLTEAYSKMQSTIISKEEMFNYFGSVFCTPDEIKEMQTGKNLQQATKAKRQEQLNSVLTFANIGTGQAETLKDGQPTLWTAYNAVTGYIARKSFTTPNDRANSMLFGTSAQLIQTAGTLAAEPQKIQKMSKIITPGNFGLN